MGKPLAGHARAVAHAVEGRVVDGRFRREIEDDDGDAGAPDDRQDGGTEGVGRDVEEDEIDIFTAEGVAGLVGFLRGVDETEVDDLHIGAGEFPGDGAEVSFEALLEAGELRPVGIQSYAEESDADRVRFHVPRQTMGWRSGGPWR